MPRKLLTQLQSLTLSAYAGGCRPMAVKHPPGLPPRRGGSSSICSMLIRQGALGFSYDRLPPDLLILARSSRLLTDGLTAPIA